MSAKEIAALDNNMVPVKTKSISERYAQKIEQDEEAKENESVAEIETSQNEILETLKSQGIEIT